MDTPRDKRVWVTTNCAGYLYELEVLMSSEVHDLYLEHCGSIYGTEREQGMTFECYKGLDELTEEASSRDAESLSIAVEKLVRRAVEVR